MTTIETKFAVVMGTGRSTVSYSPLHKGFGAYALGMNLMNEEEAKKIARTLCGSLVEIVIRDENGPCCYRRPVAEAAS